MKFKLRLGPAVVLIAALGFIILGQNCSKVDFTNPSLENSNKEIPMSDLPGAGSDIGQTLGAGAPPPPPVSVNSPPPVSMDPPPSAPPAAASMAACGLDAIKDVVLKVDHFEVKGAKGQSISISPMSDTIHMIDLSDGIAIAFPVALSISAVNVVLMADGNHYVDMDGNEHPVKTPSAQDSGWKLQLNSKVQVSTTQIYKMNGDFDPVKQLKGNAGACMLMPVWQGVSIH